MRAKEYLCLAALVFQPIASAWNPQRMIWNSREYRLAAFTSKPRTIARSTCLLRMGGYYNDPAIPVDQSKTHMIFGVRCLETKTTIATPTVGGVDNDSITGKTTTIVGLQPITEEDTVIQEYGPAMIEFLQKDWITNNNDDHTKFMRLLEVGASSTSLAASRVIPGIFSSITVCHTDEQRLRILEHAQLYFNPAPASGQLPIQTQLIQPDDPLPEADLIVFTMGAGDSADVLDRWLEEAMAMPGPPRMLVPSDLMSSEQQQQLSRYAYQKDEVYGITEIMPA